MRLLIQRVTAATLKIEEKEVATIGNGLLVLLGIECDDDKTDVIWLVNKLLNIRIFNDTYGVMNRSLLQEAGELLVISQFTLMASTKRGNRPSYIRAANSKTAIPLYEYFLQMVEKGLGKRVSKGIFGADMKVTLVNDGPVTILIDSRKRE